MSKKPSPDAVPFAGRIALVHYSLTELYRRQRALAAIEQLLRVPVPDDDPADDGSMSRVYRNDLAELLGAVGQSLDDKTDFLIELSQANQQEVLQK